jgi:mono/diheme cytochrome c family protein
MVMTTLALRQRLSRHRLALVLALGALAALAGGAVHAQNLDAGKSATRIFADNCASCHRSARGLAKGRFRLTLYLFLQQHYASNASSAWALASYLESVEGPQRRPSRAGATTQSPNHSPAARFSLRPPMPVPNR